jgi:hypothetical protein
VGLTHATSAKRKCGSRTSPPSSRAMQRDSGLRTMGVPCPLFSIVTVAARSAVEERDLLSAISNPPHSCRSLAVSLAGEAARGHGRG